MKKNLKNNRYGIWIDRKKAVIFCVDGEGKLTHDTLNSGLGVNSRFRGEVSDKTGLFGQTLNRESKVQQKDNQDFQKFLKGVVSRLENVNGILIMGPGDGRFELEKEILKKKSLASTWRENKPADKMKITEIKQVVCDHFQL